VGAYQWQFTAGNVGEVVVLIMVADVERDVVEWAIVGVCLIAVLEHVVL